MMEKDKQDGAPQEKTGGQEKTEGQEQPGRLNAGSTGFLSPPPPKEHRSWTPWIVATAVIILAIVVLVISSHSPGPARESSSGQEPAAPYAENLPITNLMMSGATSFAGMQVTYIDGDIANTGHETITGITVQVNFRNDGGQSIKQSVLPLTLIRTRQPYVDVQPVSASPLKPGDHKSFRLIFDSVPADWNEQLPEVRIVRTQSH